MRNLKIYNKIAKIIVHNFQLMNDRARNCFVDINKWTDFEISLIIAGQKPFRAGLNVPLKAPLESSLALKVVGTVGLSHKM